MKQRIGLSKALEEPPRRQGAERAMASLFWTSTRRGVPAQVTVLGAVGPVATHPVKRVVR